MKRQRDKRKLRRTIDMRRHAYILRREVEEEKIRCLKQERSAFKARKQMVSHFDPRTGAHRSVAHARVPHLVSQSELTSSRPKTLQSARNIAEVGTRGGGN